MNTKTKTLTSRKSGAFRGAALVPGDKSISHRAMMLGALASGETLVYGLLEGEDVICTMEAMRLMGAHIENHHGVWHIQGTGGALGEPATPLYMGNSGTSARLMMGMVAAHNIEARFAGDASLSKRPMERVMTPLSEMGATFKASEGGRLPLTVYGSNVLKPITYTPPIASAQVKSAILLAGLNTNGRTTVIEKHPTRDHTENMLQDFGGTVEIEKLNDGSVAVSVSGPQKLEGCAVDVPGDPSSAAFPMVAALINKGSSIQLSGVCVNPRRTGLYATLQDMGADIKFEYLNVKSREKIANVHVKASALKGVIVPAERVPDMIDEIPVLAVAAACAKGATTITNLSELRKKESDRLLLVYEGLIACGVKAEMDDKNHTLVIHGTGAIPAGGATIKTEFDHRIAMCFLVLGTATEKPITVQDAESINTSFPDFVKLMNGLGADIS